MDGINSDISLAPFRVLAGLIIIIQPSLECCPLITAIFHPLANSDRKCERRGGGRSLQPAIPAPVPRPRVSLLFLSPLSSPIVGRELEVRERSDDREFPRGIVTKLLTASRPTRARQCRGFSQVSRYRRRYRRRHPRHALSGCACQLPKNKINYGTPVFMPREGGRTRGAEESTGRARTTKGKGGWQRGGDTRGPPP